MESSVLPEDVRRFIQASVPSVPYLEAVLLLRAEPKRAWSSAELARRLYVSETVGAALLEQLRDSGVATEAEPGASALYAPSAELAALLDQVATAYARDLVTVTRLIHSRIDRRAQQFADAFRFRKE